MDTTHSFSALSDGQLVEMASVIGREIDHRWKKNQENTVQFCNSTDVFAYYHYKLWSKKQERLIALLLDQKHVLIEERIVTVGTVNASLIHAREVFSPAIEKRASGIILIHNHPTGHAAPSREDLIMMARLKKVGKLLELPLIDHVIVGKYQFYSDVLKEVIYV